MSVSSIGTSCLSRSFSWLCNNDPKDTLVKTALVTAAIFAIILVSSLDFFSAFLGALLAGLAFKLCMRNPSNKPPPRFQRRPPPPSRSPSDSTSSSSTRTTQHTREGVTVIPHNAPLVTQGSSSQSPGLLGQITALLSGPSNPNSGSKKKK